ncbi:hypothetical protein Tco_0888890 [Tanacetum coccineum]
MMVVVQNEDAPRCTAWSNEEKFATYLKIVPKGNARKTGGFWTEVLEYLCNKIKTQSSGVGDKDYFAKALLDYEAEFGVRLCFVIAGSKTSGSSSFNTESRDASINLNADIGDDDEDDVQELLRPIGRDKEKGLKKKWVGSSRSSSSMNDEALARLMVSELATQTKSTMEYRQRQEGIRFYMQPYDHLTTDGLMNMEQLRAEIKMKRNFPY